MEQNSYSNKQEQESKQHRQGGMPIVNNQHNLHHQIYKSQQIHLPKKEQMSNIIQKNNTPQLNQVNQNKENKEERQQQVSKAQTFIHILQNAADQQPNEGLPQKIQEEKANLKCQEKIEHGQFQLMNIQINRNFVFDLKQHASSQNLNQDHQIIKCPFVMESNMTIQSKILPQSSTHDISPSIIARGPSQQIAKQKNNPIETIIQDKVDFIQQVDQELNRQKINQRTHIPIQKTQKQKYRLNSQFVESVQQERQRKVVQFIQFQQEPPNKIAIQQKMNNIQQHYQIQQVHTVTTQAKKQRPILENKQNPSPSKIGVGRIAKKILHDKKIHEVIVDLQRHDAKKIVIPKLQQSKKTNKKADLSKLQTNITLNSNIMSLAIGQLTSRDDDEAQRLLAQIQQLKNKLFTLEMSKKQYQQQQQEAKWSPENVENEESLSQEPTLTNPHNKRHHIGEIYRRFQFNNSKLSQQLQSIGLNGRRSVISNHSQTVPKPRFSSAEAFHQNNSDNKEQQSTSKNGVILFRVRKNNKNSFYAEESQKNSKLTGFIKNKDYSLQKDQCFQTKMQVVQKLEFTEEEKLNIIEKPKARMLKFDQNFSEYGDKFFFDLGSDTPRKDWNQQQLVEIAKTTFSKFGVNLEREIQILHVKKYKNCVSFILDCTRTILWYYEGKFYYGGWVMRQSGDGQKSGWGYELSPRKFMYSGQFKENKRDGYGIIKFLTRENDIIYQGNWKNGLKDGLGKQKQTDNTMYIGQWLQGKKHGKGTMKISEKEIFEGVFLNGAKHGEGKQTFISGDSYAGNYLQGKFNGFGIYTWANFSRYEGQFRSGSRNGQGIWVSDYRDPKSDRYEGQYKDDKKSGFGMYYWKDGTTYEGEFLNDFKHGEGLVSYADGKSARLEWSQGNIVTQPASMDVQKNSRKNESSQKSKQFVPKAPLVKFNIKNNSKSKPARTNIGVQL